MTVATDSEPSIDRTWGIEKYKSTERVRHQTTQLGSPWILMTMRAALPTLADTRVL